MYMNYIYIRNALKIPCVYYKSTHVSENLTAIKDGRTKASSDHSELQYNWLQLHVEI